MNYPKVRNTLSGHCNASRIYTLVHRTSRRNWLNNILWSQLLHTYVITDIEIIINRNTAKQMFEMFYTSIFISHQILKVWLLWIILRMYLIFTKLRNTKR